MGIRWLTLGLVGALALPLPCWAGPTVLFADGRTLRVERVERTPEMAFLYLEGGGTVAVPAERVSNWDTLDQGRESSASNATARRVAGVTRDPGWRLAAGEHADLIARAAERHDLSPTLLTALAEVESAFDPLAVSPKGASGLLQLMPDTAERFGVADPLDAAQNVEGGARYLSWLLERYDGRADLALAGYNAGEGAVDRHQGIPPYPETRRYVWLVLDGAARLDDPAR